jgi:hypothetical protein
MSDEPGGAGDQQHELLSRLRALVEAKDAEIAVLRAELEASLERERRLELRLAALERRLSMDSSDSGTPSSRERIGAKEARRARQQSERHRRADRKRGGQPGHKGKGLARDPDPGERKEAPPPAESRKCRAGLDGAEAAGEKPVGAGHRRGDLRYLDSAAAHGVTAIGAISGALAGRPWLPPLPATSDPSDVARTARVMAGRRTARP